MKAADRMSAEGLRVLVLEDEPTDAELAMLSLAEGGFRCLPTLAAGRTAFESAFAPGRFDLVLADYSLPDYTGLEALAFVRRTDALVPFMLVSGALGEERAVEALRAGATDYILKHGLARLAPAVRRALEERRERERHLATSRALQLSQERLRALSGRLLEVQEEERRSLARDLHDDLGQALTALKIQLESLARVDRGALQPQLDDCVSTTRHALERVRQLSLNLRPLQLDDLGLVAALRSHLDRQASVDALAGKMPSFVKGKRGGGGMPQRPPPPAAGGPIRVVLAEDHALVRAGMRSLLGAMAQVQVVGEAASGEEALQLAERERPDVVLMDIAMKGMTGLAAAARMRELHPGVRVVILSMHAGEEYVLQALRAGAVGYLLKDAATGELELALRSVMRGESWFRDRKSTRLNSSHTVISY